MKRIAILTLMVLASLASAVACGSTGDGSAPNPIPDPWSDTWTTPGPDDGGGDGGWIPEPVPDPEPLPTPEPTPPAPDAIPYATTQGVERGMGLDVVRQVLGRAPDRCQDSASSGLKICEWKNVVSSKGGAATLRVTFDRDGKVLGRVLQLL